jgi:hypothetical protein
MEKIILSQDEENDTIVILDNVLFLEKTTDNKTKIIFNSLIKKNNLEGDVNFIYVKERYDWILMRMSKHFDPDGRVPSRF